MLTVLLIVAAVILPATMLVLTLCVNELEKNARALGAVLIKRYTMAPTRKYAESDPKEVPMAKAGKP